MGYKRSNPKHVPATADPTLYRRSIDRRKLNYNVARIFNY